MVIVKAKLWLVTLSSLIFVPQESRGLENSSLITEFAWKFFDYDWQSQEQKETYIKNGWYDPESLTSIDVDRSEDGRTFLTIIRDEGVPASLHTISSKIGESGPLLIPYPDWSWYENPNACDKRHITSVYRVAIDGCNRLWVLDTGLIGDEYICPAQLLAFNLKTDKLESATEIPDRVAQNKDGEGLLITPIVQVGDTCEDVTVYMADVSGHGILVWRDGKVKRIEENIFDPEENYSNFTIAGEKFTLDDGIFGMALTPQLDNEEGQYLFFRPLASRSIYGANTRSFDTYHGSGTLEFFSGRDFLSSQATAMAFSSQGTLFYGLTEEIGIGSWNMEKPFKAEYFEVTLQDTNRLQFVSGLKVIKTSWNSEDPISHQGESEYLLISSNRFQKILAGTQNFAEINFRVMTISI
ncbi:hypothetical protein QAD02_018223 [Eretmocerus hayati]|uniref:Uncharacterized protein n=1 Tax=Eretmocerus hayati TaxID=131215 RepID=A0ACC2PG31_9HYME|nr:hypothetical protein QAD02_018223 [Eretmocerus hayati]